MKHSVPYHRILALIILCLSAISAHADETDIWQAIKSNGYVMLMRHALAPGTGDPEEFVLEDCGKQRNLSEEGRDQAIEFGNRFRQNGVTKAVVYSSQWCRSLDTAELLQLGPVKPLPIINSFFRNFDRREAQTTKLKDWILTQKLDKPVILVTHQVNITALTGVYPDSGEMVVVRIEDNKLYVIGTIK